MAHIASSLVMTVFTRDQVSMRMPNVAKEWHLAEVIPSGDGDSTLEYAVRF